MLEILTKNIIEIKYLKKIPDILINRNGDYIRFELKDNIINRNFLSANLINYTDSEGTIDTKFALPSSYIHLKSNQEYFDVFSEIKEKTLVIIDDIIKDKIFSYLINKNIDFVDLNTKKNRDQISSLTTKVQFLTVNKVISMSNTHAVKKEYNKLILELPRNLIIISSFLQIDLETKFPVLINPKFNYESVKIYLLKDEIISSKFFYMLQLIDFDNFVGDNNKFQPPYLEFKRNYGEKMNYKKLGILSEKYNIII